VRSWSAGVQSPLCTSSWEPWQGLQPRGRAERAWRVPWQRSRGALPRVDSVPRATPAWTTFASRAAHLTDALYTVCAALALGAGPGFACFCGKAQLEFSAPRSSGAVSCFGGCSWHVPVIARALLGCRPWHVCAGATSGALALPIAVQSRAIYSWASALAGGASAGAGLPWAGRVEGWGKRVWRCHGPLPQLQRCVRGHTHGGAWRYSRGSGREGVLGLGVPPPLRSLFTGPLRHQSQGWTRALQGAEATPQGGRSHGGGWGEGEEFLGLEEEAEEGAHFRAPCQPTSGPRPTGGSLRGEEVVNWGGLPETAPCARVPCPGSALPLGSRGLPLGLGLTGQGTSRLYQDPPLLSHCMAL